jgi:DNA end-binding protein Ku
MAIRALDKVTISFGLVSIPTKIYSTNEPTEHIHFRMLHADDKKPVQQQWVCSKDGEVVERSEIIKGYEYKKGKFVEMTDEELDAVAQQASDAIDIQEFVPLEAVDPIYVDRTYYLGPDKGGERAYALLTRAMKKSQLAGVASYAARGKAYIVLVRPFENGLLMHQLRYPDEIKPWEEVPLGELPRVKENELELAEKVIAQLATDEFHPERYKDVVKARLKKAIAAKLEGEEITAPEPKAAGEVVDLMEALKATLGGKRGGARQAGGARAARRAKKAPKRARRQG